MIIAVMMYSNLDHHLQIFIKESLVRPLGQLEILHILRSVFFTISAPILNSSSNLRTKLIIITLRLQPMNLSQLRALQMSGM